LHYIIIDSTGDKAIVEFINGEAKVYNELSLPVPALTNNNYLESIRYIKLLPDSHYNKLDINDSQDRFLKIKTLLENSFIDDTEKHLLAMTILDSVKVSDTQWSIVYDVINKSIYYKTKLNDEIKKLSFSRSDLFTDTYGYLDVNSRIQDKYQKLTHSINLEYLNGLKKDIIIYNRNTESELVNKIDIYLLADYK
jgi:choloylglycine hydrolase